MCSWIKYVVSLKSHFADKLMYHSGLRNSRHAFLQANRHTRKQMNPTSVSNDVSFDEPSSITSEMPYIKITCGTGQVVIKNRCKNFPFTAAISKARFKSVKNINHMRSF